MPVHTKSGIMLRPKTLVALTTLLALLLLTSCVKVEYSPEPVGELSLDVQAHRGGLGEWTEQSQSAFRHAISLGVTTLELDTMLSKDGEVVIWHDKSIKETKCQDTEPVYQNDPFYPYVGRNVSALTLQQIKTLDCGYRQLPGYPNQRVATGNRISKLGELFSMVEDLGNELIRFNIEIKAQEGKDGAAESNALTKAVLAEIEIANVWNRTTLQSFDWSTLDLAKDLAENGEAKALPLVALTKIDEKKWNESVIQVAVARGFSSVSPTHTTLTAGMVADAHDAGLKVVPWTVDDQKDMASLLNIGVDGIITNYPARLMELVRKNEAPH